jgi:hypothetical protein
LDHPFTLAYALFHTGNLHMWRGEMQLTRERAKAILDIAEQHNFQIWESLATMLLGATQMALGLPEQGLAQIEAGFTRYQGLTTPPVFYPQLISMRAAAFAQAGRPAEGLELLDELIQERGEERLLRELPPLLLLKGELLLAVSPQNAPQAANLFRAILDGVSHLGGKNLTLQTATSLCKLEMLSSDAPESCRTLEEIYASFTEGFETADLRNAREVLDEFRRLITGSE